MSNWIPSNPLFSSFQMNSPCIPTALLAKLDPNLASSKNRQSNRPEISHFLFKSSVLESKNECRICPSKLSGEKRKLEEEESLRIKEAELFLNFINNNSFTQRIACPVQENNQDTMPARISNIAPAILRPRAQSVIINVPQRECTKQFIVPLESLKNVFLAYRENSQLTDPLLWDKHKEYLHLEAVAHVLRFLPDGAMGRATYRPLKSLDNQFACQIFADVLFLSETYNAPELIKECLEFARIQLEADLVNKLPWIIHVVNEIDSPKLRKFLYNLTFSRPIEKKDFLALIEKLNNLALSAALYNSSGNLLADIKKCFKSLPFHASCIESAKERQKLAALLVHSFSIEDGPMEYENVFHHLKAASHPADCLIKASIALKDVCSLDIERYDKALALINSLNMNELTKAEKSFALYMKSVCLCCRGKHEDALIEIRLAAQADPKNHWHHLQTARIYIKKEEYIKALDAINKSLACQETVKGRTIKAEIFQLLGKKECALIEYRLALQNIPNDEFPCSLAINKIEHNI